MSRLNFAPIFRGHWKGLTNGVGAEGGPDWTVRGAIIILPIGTTVVAYFLEWRFAAAAPLLAGVSLLAGALLSSFTYLSTLRMKIVEWTKHEDDSLKVERSMLDETAAHLLAASFACALDTAVLVIGMNVSGAAGGAVEGVWAALATGVSVYVLLIFIICLPRLYSAYVQVNDVSDRYSGFVKGRRKTSRPDSADMDF